MSFRVARVSGVPVRIHLSCVLTFLLLSYMIAFGFIAQADSSVSALTALLAGGLSVLLLFGCLLLHEWGHVLSARRYGVEACSVDLFLLGGESRLRCEAPGWQGELWIALAGPAVSAVLAGVSAAVLRFLEPGSMASIIAFYLAFANVVLALANFIPAYPLDGGRALHAALWRLSGDLPRANRITALLGEALGLAAAAYGAFLLLTSGISGLWPIVIGWYVFDAASRMREAERTPVAPEAALHGSAG